MIPKRLVANPRGSRRPNTLEQEREHSEKTQEASFRKAINNEETPTKSKHVRILILATHKDKNALHFWRLAGVYEPRTSDVHAWKFCHTLHVLLRDGHAGAIRDAQPHATLIRDVGRHFRRGSVPPSLRGLRVGAAPHGDAVPPGDLAARARHHAGARQSLLGGQGPRLPGAVPPPRVPRVC